MGKTKLKRSNDTEALKARFLKGALVMSKCTRLESAEASILTHKRGNLFRTMSNKYMCFENIVPNFALKQLQEQIKEIKGVGRRTGRTQLLEDLRNRRRYWELKEEAEDRERWKRQFIG